MHKLLEKHMAQEESHAKREIHAGIHSMVSGGKTFNQQGICAELKEVFLGYDDSSIALFCYETYITDILAVILSGGYGKLTPVQAIASRCIVDVPEEWELEYKEKLQITLEYVLAVATVSIHARVVPTEGSYYIVSEYKHNGIDNAVHNACYPIPSIVPPKAIVDIDSNAGRCDSGYRTMLGGPLKRNEGVIPLEEINYLSSIRYGIEEVAHVNRPVKLPKVVISSVKVAEQIRTNAMRRVQGTRDAMKFLYESGNVFYYPHSLDVRFRMFSSGYQLNLQGTEFDKSVIEFKTKLYLNDSGYEALLIATANVFGKDKLTFSERLLWAYNNLDTLEDLTDEADEKLLYAKHVRAIRAHQKGLPVGIPVHFDATASGIQINGCFLACEKTMLISNCILNAHGKRIDAYTVCHKDMLRSCDLVIDRKVFKDGMIPSFFGSEAEPRAVFGDYVDVYWRSIEHLVPGAFWYLKMLPQLWDMDTTEYSFTTPDGYKVVIPVTGSVTDDVYIHAIGAEVPVSREVVGRKEMSKCFLAHMTHAYDAYIMRVIVKKCKAHKMDIMCIHDSFGIHPNHAAQVAEWYRIELANIVRSNPLPRLLKEIFGVNVALPNFSEKSREELAKLVLESKYTLS